MSFRRSKLPKFIPIVSLLILLVLGPIVFSFLQNAGKVEAAWVDDNFSYRNAIPITSHTAAESNVYISATIDTSASGQFQSDCGDLRFTTVGGDILPYYIVSGCVSASTVVHVFFKSMPAGAQTIYYYYGNPSAANGFSSADFATQATAYALGSVASQEKGGAPIAYWKFDEGTGTTTKDSSSNASNGTVNSATWKSEDQCLSGKCLFFTSTNTVSIADPANGSLDFGTGNFTISAWIRTGISADNRNLIRKGAGDGSSGWRFGLSSGVPDVLIGDTATHTEGTLGSTSIADNKWHQMTVVFNRSGNAVGFVDGQQVGTLAISTVNLSVNNASAIDIGNSFATFTGFIDDVKLYNYARTAAQIKSDFKSRGAAKGTSVGLGSKISDLGSLSNGLVGYWKMDEASWTNDCSTASVLDASGNANNGKACPASTGPTGGAAGKFGNAGSFDGTNDYLDVSDNASLKSFTSMTVSMWFKATNWTNQQVLISKDGNSGWYWQYTTGTSALNFYVSGSNKGSVGNPSTGSWHHLVATYNGSNIRTFLDGAETTGGTLTGTMPSSTGSLFIGAIDSASYRHTGSLDEIRIYNRALSPREVRDLYNWAPGPVAYYDLEDSSGQNVTDKSGNGNTGTLGASSSVSTDDPTWASGKYGKGLSLDGGDYTKSAYSAAIQPASLTVSAWIKPATSQTGNPRIVGKTHIEGSWSTPWVQYELILLSGTTPRADVNSGGSLATLSSNTTVPTNTWSFLTMTFDDSSKLFSIYINGVLKNSSTLASSIQYTNQTPLYIGSINEGSMTDFFNGVIDDVRIYNYARSQKQIVEDMNAGHPVGGSPVGSQVGYWRFDEGYGTTANNSGSGGTSLNGVVTNATWTNNGKFGKALSFDGTGDYVGITHNQGNNIKTVSVWFKLNSLPTGIPGGIVLANASSTSGPTGFDKLLRVTTSGKIEYYFHDGSGRNATGTTTLTTGVWYYAAGVTEGSRTVVYLNGKEEGSYASVSTNSSNYAIVDFDDTAYSSYAQDVNGVIDEVKLYNAALTSDEIALDYNRGQAMVLGTLSDTSGLTGGSVASSSASAEYCIPGDTATCTPPVARWNFEEKSGTTVNDITGTSNSGTIGGSTWKSGDCKKGACLSLNGTTSDYVIKNPANSFPTSTLTVEYWMKSSDTTKSGTGFSYAVTGSDNEFIVYNYQSIDIYANSTSVATSISANDGRWHHIAVTWQSSNGVVKLYKDGAQAYSGTLSSGTAIDAGGSMVIGQEQDSVGGGFDAAQAFLGSIDQFALFNYVRTPAQIAWDYNQGKPVGHWRLDDCQGSTAKDSSGNGNNGTITIGGSGTQTAVGTCTTSGTAWYNGVTGKFNSSLNFDGTDDYINLGNPSLLSLSDRFSISYWIKSNNVNSILVAIGKNLSWYFTTYLNKMYYREYNGTSWTTDMAGNTTLSTGTWYHFVLTKNGVNVDMYLNGTIDKSITNAETAVSTNSNNVEIARFNSSFYYPGQVDDVRIYNYALTATQVKNLYNGGAAVKFAPSTGSP